MNPTQLKTKSDQTLITDLKSLVAKERETLTEILNYLNEVETRRLYLARGYSSLFSFMMSELNYSESAAQRRIEAMRLIRQLPEVEEKIVKGEISLTVASQVASYFRQENQKRREDKIAPITSGEKLSLLESLQGTSSRECEKKLAQINPEPCLPKEKTKPISEERTLIQFTAGKALMNKIEKLKSILSHQTQSGSLEELFEKLSDIALEKLDPARREQRRAVRASTKCAPLPPSPPAPEVNRRRIPQALRDKIWLRDRGQCQHRDAQSGRVCGSTQRLEIDHLYPFALGGEASPENLQLKCSLHNQLRAKQLFGDRPYISLNSIT